MDCKMCTKTKNSYGCGHVAKIFEGCGVPGCTDIARYKVPGKNQDCQKCKNGGADVTRGRDGKGMYAREIGRSRQSSSDSYAPSSPGTPHMSVSPWILSDRSRSKEKRWDTPTRKKADDAWVIEHERRMSDLDEKTNKLSITPPPHRSRTNPRPYTSPHSSYEQIDEAIYEEPDELPLTRSRPKAIDMLPYEISDESDLARSHRRSRKTSYDSDQSASLYQSQSTKKNPRRRSHYITPISEHDPYDSSRPVDKSKRHGPKTEPYQPVPQTCFFGSPISGSPITGGKWEGRYELVHPPLQLEYYQPRTYPVH